MTLEAPFSIAVDGTWATTNHPAPSQTGVGIAYVWRSGKVTLTPRAIAGLCKPRWAGYIPSMPRPRRLDIPSPPKAPRAPKVRRTPASAAAATVPPPEAPTVEAPKAKAATKPRAAWRPKTRGDCLTSRERYHLSVLYSDDSNPVPAPGGWVLPNGKATVAGAPGALPTDGQKDGANCQRPCPYIGCKYNLVLDYNPTTGAASFAYAQGEEDLIQRLLDGEATIQAGLIPEYLNGELDPATYPPGVSAVTCALDVSDWSRGCGGATLEAVGMGINRTRERVRQMEEKAADKLQLALYEDGTAADMEALVHDGVATGQHPLAALHMYADD